MILKESLGLISGGILAFFPIGALIIFSIPLAILFVCLEKSIELNKKRQ